MAGVLVIENEQPLLRLLTWALMDSGFSVSMSRSADDAIARAHQIEPSAIVLNMAFGPEVKQSAIKRLRASYRHACLIDMLTPLDQDMPRSAADVHIGPPYAVVEIVDHINHWTAEP